MSKVELKEDKLIKISFSDILVTPEKASELISYLLGMESTIKADFTQDYLEGKPVYSYDSIYRNGIIPVACKSDGIESIEDIFNVEMEEISKYVEMTGRGVYSCHEEIEQVWNSTEQTKEKQ